MPATQVTYEEALAATIEAIERILVDRGVATEERPLTEDVALYAFDDDVADALDLDSLDALDVVTILEERFEAELPEDIDFAEIRTVGDVAQALLSAVTAERDQSLDSV